MLTEAGIEKLISPIIQRQEIINDYVVELIAKRVKEIGKLLPSDVYKLERLLKSGADVRKINKEIARLTHLNVEAIKQLIKSAAMDAYNGAKPYYDYRGKPFIPLAKNKPLNRVIQAVGRQTINTYVNMSKAQAFMLRDLKDPTKLIPTPLSKAYYSIIDEAVQASQSGVLDYNTAMRRTMRQLSDSGIRYVEYNTETGKHYSQRLDTAVRRNLMDGIRAINQKVQDITGEQYGADGKEITVHSNSAPDHEPVQGHQFTNEEYEKLQNNQPFQDLMGRHFEAIKRPIGVLNCYHFTYSIICGVNKPNFTLEQLDKMIEENHKGYTDSKGRHYTMYECTQKQRQMETNIRRQKDRYLTLSASGDVNGAAEARAKVSQLTKTYKAFSNSCGLSPKINKARVQGYK